MRFLTWNIRGNTGIRPDRLARILDVIKSHAVDLVALQEVSCKDGVVDTLLTGLASHGLEHSVIGETRAGYGNLVVSRWPVEKLAPDWFNGPRPSSVTGCTVDGPNGVFAAVCAHVPNGSGNGWVKIETFEALATALQALMLPVVLGGDFNEPRTVLEDGSVISFAMKQGADEVWHMRGNLKAKCGRTFPRARWARGVRLILGREPSVRLRHALRVRQGPTAWHTTHLVRGRERFFDHILASPEWKVVGCAFDDACRTDKSSDHSAVVADFHLQLPIQDQDGPPQ